MNLLMTLDRNYIPQLNVMLFSALHCDSAAHFDVYLLHDEGLSEEDVVGTRVLLGQRGELHLIRVDEDGLADAPTSDRYPKAIYYRIFAAKYLPDTLDRVLYLDPDIVVRQSLRELYAMPMGTAFFAAATHIRGFLHRFNELRLDMDEDSPYINSGVMLMNLQALRAEQDTQAVFDYMDAHKGRLMLPDQDIISALYGQRILPLDPIRYNMTEKLFALHRHNGDGMTLEDVRQQSAVIHYCGRNKPWKPGYLGELNVFYNEAVSQMSENGHFCITPRGVEADGTDLLAALHRVDGQLPSRGRSADRGRIIHHIEDRRRQHQRRTAHHVPAPQEEYFDLAHKTCAPFCFLPYPMPLPAEIYPAAAPRSLPAAQGKGPSA